MESQNTQEAIEIEGINRIYLLEWMNEGMNEWMKEWINEWMNEWMKDMIRFILFTLQHDFVGYNNHSIELTYSNSNFPQHRKTVIMRLLHSINAMIPSKQSLK